ncbi:hypothetical protein HHE06_03220 [Helicobacter heilmannii]|nr:hypothetical protein HHE06_03220 [Helicobacter heilmannii]
MSRKVRVIGGPNFEEFDRNLNASFFVSVCVFNKVQDF